MSTTWNPSDPWPRYQPYASEETIGSWREDSTVKRTPENVEPQQQAKPQQQVVVVSEWRGGHDDSNVVICAHLTGLLVLLVTVGPILAFIGVGIWYYPEWLLPFFAVFGIVFYVVRKKWGPQIGYWACTGAYDLVDGKPVRNGEPLF